MSNNRHQTHPRPRPSHAIARFFRRSSETEFSSPVAASRSWHSPSPSLSASVTENSEISFTTTPSERQGGATSKREKAGLWEWPTEDKNEPDTVYIIAVHGLQGDCEKTWEEDGKIWLRDFLPNKIDKVQVMSFGYFSTITSSGWEHELEHFSAQLLQAVKDHADTEQKRLRPIIFLGHSFGGLIIKKALILAHNKQIPYSGILERTAGLIFMGTPHRGSDIVKWTSMLKELLNVVGVGSNTELLADLKRRSRTLMQINSDFVERGPSIPRILSFYEMHGPSRFMGPVVDQDSATLGLQNEITIGLNADHNSMSKFSREDSQAFSAVWRPIRDMVNSLRNKSLDIMKEKRKHILEALRESNVVGFGYPSTDTTQPTEGTCQWICSNPNYTEWHSVTQRLSVLWITGGPGSGKSFLSNFISNRLDRDNAIVCKYSFTRDRSTPLGFLKSMVSQALVGKNVELCHYAIEIWDTDDLTLSWDSIWALWTKVCENLKSGQIFWVIDALDECNDPPRRKDLLKRIMSLHQKLNQATESRLCFRVLLTSRPEIWRELPPSTEDTSVLSRIILENESAIEDDIRSFIYYEVQMLAREGLIQRKDIEKLQTRLCNGADRTFIWPQLTLQAIRNDPEAYNDANWELVLQEIPSDLEGIYEKLLSQLSGNKEPHTRAPRPLPSRTKKLLQFVLAGQGLFTVSELNVLLALERNPDTILQAEKEAEDIGPVVERVYGSFLRATTDAKGVSHVRLFHDTARKHLLLPYSKSKYAMELQECHLELAKGCISYLWLDDLGDILTQSTFEAVELLSSQHPLFQYTNLHWAHHVRESEELMNQELLERVMGMYKVASQRYRNWTRTYWSLTPRGIGGSTTTPLQMCAYNGHSRILKQLLESIDSKDAQEEIDQKDAAGNTALHYATSSGRSKAIATLLKFGADSRIRNNSGHSVLHKAVIANEEDVVLALLSGGVNVNIRTDGDNPGRTVLHLAAESGLQSMVELLVKHGANIDIVDSTSSTAAKIAFDKGYGAISRFLDSKQLDSGITDLDRAIIDSDDIRVRSLVEGGASLSSKDNRGSTPLHRAARVGSVTILRFLLGATSATDIQDDDGMTPLHVASRYGNLDAVELLIGKGAVVDAISADGLSPLHQGVLSGKRSVVDRLLDAGANQSHIDRNGLTPLFIASSQGYDEIVELLLRKDKSGKVSLTANDSGRLPVHIAAKNGHLATVRALIFRDENILNLVDREGCTPLSLAANGNSKGHAETVKFLVELGAALSHRQLNGSTPLHQAAQSGNELSIKYLLGHDCNIPSGEKIDLDVRNSSRNTPLTLAAAEGHESVVELLLKQGAGNNRSDLGAASYPTDRDLLSWVAGHGMTDTVKLLLETPGILIDSVDGSDRTPLSWAAGNGHSDVVIQLLDPTRQTTPIANVNSLDVENNTPLSWAAMAGHETVVKVLLSYGADPTIKNLDLGPPIIWAVVNGHSKVFSALIRSGKIKDEDMFDSSGNPLLALAAANGRTEVVKLILDHENPAINNINAPKRTDDSSPLILATEIGHEEIVGILLDRGADIHYTIPGRGMTALTVAIETGHWVIVEMLIKHDATVLQAVTKDGKSPLYLAVETGFFETVEILLHYDFDFNIRAQNGNTLLHAAAGQGYFLVLDQILKHAGHLLTEENFYHETPLFSATKGGHEQAVTMLLRYAREKNIPEKDLVVQRPGTKSILTAAVEGRNAAVVKAILGLKSNNDGIINMKDREGWSPLTCAASYGNAEILHQLLRPENVDDQDPNEGMGTLLMASMDGNEDTIRLLLTNSRLKTRLNRYAKNNRGCNSLWIAIRYEHYQIVRLLLEDQGHQTALKREWLNSFDQFRGYMLSPLQLSVVMKHTEIVKLLLREKDININAQDSLGRSAFLSAIETGDEYLVRILAETPAVDVNLRDHGGRTALMLACEEGYFDIAQYLIKECGKVSVPIDAIDNEGLSALSHAICGRGADAAIVKLLLDSDASISHTVPPHNRNHLMLASARGGLQIVKLLCERGELDIDASDNGGLTALSIAAQANMSNIVRMLLEKGANPNSRARRSKRTPLMEAARRGCAAAIRELILSPRIDFTCSDDANISATWFLMSEPNDDDAAQLNQNQHLSVAEFFLEFHHDSLSINEVDIRGISPLLLLTNAQKRFEVRRLLELKADFKHQTWNGLSVFHIAALKSSPWTLRELLAATISEDTFDCKDLDHATPLSYAAGNSIEDSPLFGSDHSSLNTWENRTELQVPRCQMVRMLLNRGANVNSTTLSRGRTPLMFAARLGWNQIVTLLLERGADVDMRDKDYSTALSLAVKKGHFSTVRHLLEANAAFNIKDKTGDTLIIIAAKYGHLSLLRLFMDSYSMDINHRDRNGRTALSYAAENNHAHVVHYLTEHPKLAEVDALDRQDQTALVWACKMGRCLIISLLIDFGADPKRKDKNGRTPFSHAAENGQIEVLRQLLVSEGEDDLLKILEWKDDAGRTALSWAAEEGRLEVVRVLLKWGADPLSSDNRKQTPRMFALDKGHTKVAKLLASDHASPGPMESNNSRPRISQLSSSPKRTPSPP